MSSLHQLVMYEIKCVLVLIIFVFNNDNSMINEVHIQIFIMFCEYIEVSVLIMFKILIYYTCKYVTFNCYS